MVSSTVGRAGAKTLSLRALNRATLARQMLLRRHRLSIPDALEHLVGLQAQATGPPYIGLWTRLEEFEFQELNRLLAERRVVRSALMRGTLHVVTARDVLGLRPILQPVLDRSLLANHRRHLTGLNLAAVATAARNLLGAGPLTYAALGKLLQEQWPERPAELLAMVARNCEVLVQASPVLWGGGNLVEMTTVKNWLGKCPRADATPGPLVIRYLAACGPASIADIRSWSGLSGVAEIVATLKPQLRTFRAPSGAELFDLSDAPRPDPDTPSPARLLSGFDALVLSHADRTRFLDEAHRKLISTSNGIFHPTVLIDGRISGTWKIAVGKNETSIEIAQFSPATKRQRIELTEEAVKLLKVVAADAKRHDVLFSSSR